MVDITTKTEGYPSIEDLTKLKDMGVISDFYIDSNGDAYIKPIQPINWITLGPINFQLDKKE